MTPDEILGSLETYGYVIIPDLIPPPLLGPLREASSRVIARARDESDAGWPHVYVSADVGGGRYTDYGADGW